MKLGNPEEGSGEMLDFSFAVTFGELLFVVVETSGETTLGVFVHFFGADLELDDLFIRGNDGGMERLVTVLFRDGDIIFDAATHRSIERVDEAEDEVTGCDVVDNDAEGC